jgi:ubiquinone/menaquinone biosynthesis C-methylase UbiE
VNTSLYEHPAWQNLPEQVMRPGGLAITQQALAFCDLQPGARVLDVGCGAGAALRSVTAERGLQGFAVDISAPLLSQAHRHNPEAVFARARGECLPFAGESLDAIMAECTLSIMDSETALREWARALKSGGYLMFSDLYARNEKGIETLRKLPPGTCIGAAMSQAQILENLSRSGLRVSVWQDCSEKLKDFSVCTLTTAAKVDPFDLYIAAGRAKIGYFFCVASKICPTDC